MCDRRFAKNGFTRVELVVVMACIALLAGLVWSMPRRARRHAKSIVCQTNLQQWSQLFIAL